MKFKAIAMLVAVTMLLGAVLTLLAPTASAYGYTAVTVDSARDGAYVSIATDSQNNVHMVYLDMVNTDLIYANNIGGTWTSMIADNNLRSGYFASIAIDKWDNVHIAYLTADDGPVTGSLMYLKRTGASWTGPITVDNPGASHYTGYYSSIEVDSVGVVHILYYDNTLGNLRYAKNNTGTLTFTTSTVFSTGNV